MPGQVQRSQSKKILLIEGNAFVRIALHNVLKAYGHIVTPHATGEEAIPSLLARNYSVVICNQHLSGITGLDFFAKMRPHLAHTTTVLTAALADDYLSNKAQELGINIFMEKPFKIEYLMECIDNDTVWGSKGYKSEHIYFTNYGRIFSISPPKTGSISIDKKIQQPYFRKSINRMGRNWKVYINCKQINAVHGHGVPTL